MRMEKKIISGIFKKLGFILFSLLIFISGFSAEKKKAINALEHPLFIKLMKLPMVRIVYGKSKFIKRVKINVSSKVSHPSKVDLGSWTNISGDQYTIYINPNKLAKTYVLDEDYRPFTPSILRALVLELQYVHTVETYVDTVKVSEYYDKKPKSFDFTIKAGESALIQKLMPKSASRLIFDKCSNMFGLIKDLKKSSYSSCGTASTNSYSSKSKDFYSNTSKDFYADTSKDFYSTTSKDIYSAKSNTNSKQNCDEYDLKQKRKKYFSSCQKMVKDASNYDAYKSSAKSDAEIFAEIEVRLRKSKFASKVLDWKSAQNKLKIKFDDKKLKYTKSGIAIPAWFEGGMQSRGIFGVLAPSYGKKNAVGTITINRNVVRNRSFITKTKSKMNPKINTKAPLTLDRVYIHEILHLYIDSFNLAKKGEAENQKTVDDTNKVMRQLDESALQRLNHRNIQ